MYENLLLALKNFRGYLKGVGLGLRPGRSEFGHTRDVHPPLGQATCLPNAADEQREKKYKWAAHTEDTPSLPHLSKGFGSVSGLAAQWSGAVVLRGPRMH